MGALRLRQRDIPARSSSADNSKDCAAVSQPETSALALSILMKHRSSLPQDYSERNIVAPRRLADSGKTHGLFLGVSAELLARPCKKSGLCTVLVRINKTEPPRPAKSRRCPAMGPIGVEPTTSSLSGTRS